MPTKTNTKEVPNPKRPKLGIFRNRNLTKARFLFFYLVGSGIGMFLWSLFCIFTGQTELLIYVITPIVLMLTYFLMLLLVRNFKVLVLYAFNYDQGRLMVALNDGTHFSEGHKLKLVHWVYPDKKTVRNEKWLELSQKARMGTELTKQEKKLMRRKVATCPQQLLDGFNKALLVNTLIYAHRRIKPLDEDLRNLLELTKENMDAFNLEVEINKCRTSEYQKQYNKAMEIGLKDGKI